MDFLHTLLENELFKTLCAAVCIVIVTAIVSGVATGALRRAFQQHTSDEGALGEGASGENSADSETSEKLAAGKVVGKAAYKVADKVPQGTIFINVLRACIWILGVCVLLSTCFHIDVTAAIAALGIGGIAISLGFQDTLSNLIGGLQMSLMRLVCIGDTISVDGKCGVVEDITWRHTLIRDESNNSVIIPNSVMSKQALIKVDSNNN